MSRKSGINERIRKRIRKMQENSEKIKTNPGHWKLRSSGNPEFIVFFSLFSFFSLSSPKVWHILSSKSQDNGAFDFGNGAQLGLKTGIGEKKNYELAIIMLVASTVVSVDERHLYYAYALPSTPFRPLPPSGSLLMSLVAPSPQSL